ncbi:MAG: alkaline phosphatase family protein [Bdellovibrionales bacterium]
MKRILAVLGLVFGIGFQAQAAPWAVAKPKLVVVIVIDQFRADYLSRFQNLFGKNGFMALINNGAYFPYGEYDLLQAMTGPGHATILTGAYPYQMGIPLNDWYDQKTNSETYCVEDPEAKSVGTLEVRESTSPKNLQGTTVGDELKNADWPGKVISLAVKDRAAILMGGHRADLALWMDKEDKKWVSSTYYRKDSKLPEWMVTLNSGLKDKKCNLEEACGIEMTVGAVKAALAGEKLGQGKGSDILALSFSSFDFAGHHFGPNADEMRVMTVAEDKAVADIRAAVQAKVPGGLKNVLFVLTGDHGVAPKPEYLAGTGVETGRINEEAALREMNVALNKKYGKPKQREWVVMASDFNFFVDEENVRDAKLDIAKIENEMKEILLKNSGFAHVFTRAEYEAHQLPPGMFERKIQKTYFKGRSGHVVGIQKPFFVPSTKKNDANHLTGYVFDRTVPIILSGFGIKNGLYSTPAEVVDIAPTISFLLGILPPALSEGHVLSSALK